MTEIVTSLPDWLPDPIRNRWAVALYILRGSYTDDQIVEFMAVVRATPAPRLGLPARYKRATTGSNDQRLSGGPSCETVPIDALGYVYDLVKAVNDAKKVTHEGVSAYIGPGADQIYKEKINKRHTSTEKNERKEPARQRAIELFARYENDPAYFGLSLYPGGKTDSISHHVARDLENAGFLESFKDKGQKRPYMVQTVARWRREAYPKGTRKRGRRRSCKVPRRLIFAAR